MPVPSEPERYSIDDMMERLKNRPAEDPLHEGELVTRADGTQAIKVRKRKRRSHQPHKEQETRSRRARMIQVSGALVLMLLALFAAGAAILYANSAPFREALLRKIAASTGATVELRGFRMNPTSANADGLTLKWPEGNALAELSTRTLKAEIFPSSFLGTSMAGEELSAAEGTLTLRIPQPGQPKQSSAAETGLPIRFNRYSIPKLQVFLGDPKAPLMRMTNSEASLQPVTGDGRPQLLIARGDLTLAGWPKLRMDRSHIEFRGPEVDIISMRLRYDDDSRGTFELSGSISPFDMDKESNLSLALESFQFAGIAGPEFGSLIVGRFDTQPSAKSNFLTFAPGKASATSMTVDFQRSLSTNAELNGFAFLHGLSLSLDEDWFARPVFESQARGTLRRGDGVIKLEDLNFENKNRIALRGSLAVGRNRSISGEVRLGVTEAILKASKNRALDTMFGTPEEGFRWVDLTISGGAGAPNDNFRDLYDAALKSGKPATSGATPSFEELTRPR